MNDMPAFEPPVFDPNDRSLDGGDAGFADALSGEAYGSASGDAYGSVRHTAPMRLGAGLVGVAQNQLLALAESGKADLVRNVGSIAALVREVSAQVENVGIEPFAGYARRASGLVDDLHGSIRDRSVEDLIDDGRAIVRQNPQITIIAATILGFIAARVLKAQR